MARTARPHSTTHPPTYDHDERLHYRHLCVTDILPIWIVAFIYSSDPVLPHLLAHVNVSSSSIRLFVGDLLVRFLYPRSILGQDSLIYAVLGVIHLLSSRRAIRLVFLLQFLNLGYQIWYPERLGDHL